jgi:predicted acylesterase/phospholipase RssA
MTSVPDVFIDVANLVAKLIAFKNANPEKKIAFSFSGGGARAAWFGGVLEAIEKEVRNQQPNVPDDQRIAPDIIAGTSGGALAGLGYFCDLLNSEPTATSGLYFNRQSWLWRDVAHGNEGASKLLDNPEILELLSGSKVGHSEINWNNNTVSGPMSMSSLLHPNFSPSYNFKRLFDSKAELESAWDEVQVKWDQLRASFSSIKSDVVSIVNGVPLNFNKGWMNFVNDANYHLALIQTKITSIGGHCDDLIYHIKKVHLDKAAEDVGYIVNDSGGLVKEAADLVSNGLGDLAQIPIGIINGIFDAITKLAGDIQLFANRIVQFASALDAGLLQSVMRFMAIVTSLSDIINFVFMTGRFIKKNASLMGTSGLEKGLNEVLRLAVPVGTIRDDKSAEENDKALFQFWAEKRKAKRANPAVRAPELILTASNITAGRVALLALCDQSTAQDLANSHTWVIALNSGTTQALPGAKRKQIGTYDSQNWVFGVPDRTTLPPEVLDLGSQTARKAAIPSKVAPAQNLKGLDATAAAATTAPRGSTASPFAPLGQSIITGHSILAAAALTSSSIPIAFPPRQWHFVNPVTGKTFQHLFVDGGICDNVPMQQAINAGADLVVSFELVPMRHAVADIPLSELKPPTLMGVAGAALSDTPLTSAFFRFVESYVGDKHKELLSNTSDPSKVKNTLIWRISPEHDSTVEDTSVGAYDFNGKWMDGELRTGLYDWFMRGYMDAHGPSAETVFAKQNDRVWQNYNQLSADFGQKENANSIMSAFGFYAVDYVNNKPHPEYGD